MLKLDLYRNNNESSTKYGRVYSRVNNAKPIDEIGLAKNMHSHYTTFSIGELSGMIRDMVNNDKGLRSKIAENRSIYYVLTNLTFLHFISAACKKRRSLCQDSARLNLL